MDKDMEEILKNAEAMLAIEGLEVSAEEIEAAQKCLLGISTFELEVQSIIDKAKAAAEAQAA